MIPTLLVTFRYQSFRTTLISIDVGTESDNHRMQRNRGRADFDVNVVSRRPADANRSAFGEMRSSMDPFRIPSNKIMWRWSRFLLDYASKAFLAGDRRGIRTRFRLGKEFPLVILAGVALMFFCRSP